MKHGKLRQPDCSGAGGFFRGPRNLDRDELQVRRRRVPLTVFAALAVSATLGCQDAAKPTSPDIPLTGANPAVGAEKTAVCHAAGRENDLKFVELTLSGSALSAHVSETGGARPGHDGDYLVTTRTPCPPPPLTAPNVRICKAVDAQIPLSRLFDFEVNGEKISISGSTCVDRSFRVGTPVTITETVAAGTFLHSISITPQTAGTGGVAGATASIIAGDDRADVTFSNRARLAPLRICKDIEPIGLLGRQFQFEAIAQGIETTHYVRAGWCSVINAYPVGTGVTVFEMVGTWSSLDAGVITTNITVDPADRLVPGSIDLQSRRVSVTVGEGGTLVRYVNARPVGSLEFCNATPAGITGASQFFVVEMYGDERSASVNVPANQCMLVQSIPFGFPLNYVVRVGEPVVPSGLRLDAVTVDPPDRLSGTPDLHLHTAIVRIGTGNTKVTFHHVLATP